MAIKINEIVVENETALKSLKATAKKKEELLVSENFVRLDVKRLRDLLYKKADQVYTLENRKYQLQLSMEERRAEIAVHKEVLRAQLRIAKDEKAARAKELGEKLMKVEKLRKKYQTLSLRFQNQGSEEDNEEHTQAYFIIKAAQRKEELQKQKEELEAIERQARSEIMSLQASLASFNALNQRLHGQKTRGALTSSDFEESSRLEVTLKNMQISQKEKISKLEKVENILSAMQNTAQELGHEKDALLQEISEINSRKIQLDHDLEDLKTKNQRALSQLSKYF